MVTSFAHAALTVQDMDKSVDFYTRVLGFKKAFDILEPETGKPWIVYIAVAPGQEVKAGEILAKIEAMKMENVLKAERDCVVDKLMAAAGESLSVDQVIIEFE